MSKRILFLSLVVLLVLPAAAVLAGGSGETSKGPIVLKWYTDADDVTNTQVRKAPEFIAQFEKENPGIIVQVQSLVGTYDSDAYNKKADVMIAAGEQIDLLSESTLDRVIAKVKAGVFEPLKPYAQKEGVDLEKEYNGIIPIDGQIYTIPEYVTSWLVYINKDMLDAAGLPLPPRDWTWADYRTYAKKLTHGDGASKVYGSYMHSWDWFYAIGMQSKIMDKPYFKKDGTPNFDDPVFRDGLQYRWNLEQVDKSQIPVADLLSQKMAYRAVFFGGKAAMLPMGAWMVADIKNKENFPHTFKTTFATFPRWDTTTKANTTTLDGAGSGWAVNSKSQYKDAAYKFLRFFTTRGWEYAHSLWSAWTKTDAAGTIRGMGGSDETLYDPVALQNIVFDPLRVQNKYTFAGPGEPEIVDAWIGESQKYLVGGQSLDEAMANIKQKANDIVARVRAGK